MYIKNNTQLNTNSQNSINQNTSAKQSNPPTVIDINKTGQRSNPNNNSIPGKYDCAKRIAYFTDNLENSVFSNHEVHTACPEKPIRLVEAISALRKMNVMTEENTFYL